MTENKTLNC